MAAVNAASDASGTANLVSASSSRNKVIVYLLVLADYEI